MLCAESLAPPVQSAAPQSNPEPSPDPDRHSLRRRQSFNYGDNRLGPTVLPGAGWAPLGQPPGAMALQTADPSAAASPIAAATAAPPAAVASAARTASVRLPSRAPAQPSLRAVSQQPLQASQPAQTAMAQPSKVTTPRASEAGSGKPTATAKATHGTLLLGRAPARQSTLPHSKQSGVKDRREPQPQGQAPATTLEGLDESAHSAGAGLHSTAHSNLTGGVAKATAGSDVQAATAKSAVMQASSRQSVRQAQPKAAVKPWSGKVVQGIAKPMSSRQEQALHLNPARPISAAAPQQHGTRGTQREMLQNSDSDSA